MGLTKRPKPKKLWPKKVKKQRTPSRLDFLPEGALFLIADSLAEVEPGGVRGPSLVSQDLCNLGMVCKALRSTTQHGLQTLAQQVLHRLQQSQNHGGVLLQLPHTDAAAAAAEASRAAAAAAANTAAAPLVQQGSPGGAGEVHLHAGGNAANAAPSVQPPPQLCWSYWDARLPAVAAGNCSLEDLQADALWLHIPGDYAQLSKEALEIAVLGAFCIVTAAAGRIPPAVLLTACRREQRSSGITADGPDECAALHAALKRLAELAREVWLPLGLQAQRWGYGRRRPPGWPTRTALPASQKGVAYAVPGGLAAIRAGWAAAGIHSLQQLQQLVAAEVEKDKRRRAALAGTATAAGKPQQVPPGQQQQLQQRQKAASRAWKHARAQAGQQRLEEQAARLWGQVMCSTQCGSLAAKWCVRQCCGDCCRKAAAAATAAPEAEPCVRHKVRQPATDEEVAEDDATAAATAAADPAAND